jgi:urease accessory protein
MEAGGAASLIVVCAAPGVFPGDDLRQSVRVEPGARVTLRSQSALQVHPGDGPAARIASRYEVDAGAELRCLWDPLIPFPEAEIVQRVEIALAQDSRFYWSDAMLTGRCARGEAWVLRMLDHELRLSIDGALQYLERYRLMPSGGHRAPGVSATHARDVATPWIAGDASHLGTILAHHADAGAAKAETLQQRLDRIESVRAGVDIIARHLMVGRLLGWRGPAFTAARMTAEELVGLGQDGREGQEGQEWREGRNGQEG